MMTGGRGHRFLFWCASDHLQFRIPEFDAIAKLFNMPFRWLEKSPSNEPWVILELSGVEDAKKILSRSLATKYCIELWGQGHSQEELHTSLKDYPLELKQPFCRPDQSFKIYVEAYMNKLSKKQQLEKIESLSHLPFQGPVSLTNPDVVFSYFEFYGFDHNNLPARPTRAFFGRCVGEGQREVVATLSIKTRKFIGNTTMDPKLALLMANLGQVRPGDMVLDPFVGTGSLLIAAAYFGGYVMGSDIDYLMLHARTRPSRVGQKKRDHDENMKANFVQYGLQNRYLDSVVCDASQSPWHRTSVFDVIIADPPYGIREPTERIGTKKQNVVIMDEYLDKHIPQKIEYGMGEMYSDLMNFSSRYLTPGGRLVFWIPIVRETYDPEKLPRHPAFNLLANCEQILSSHTSRRLLVFEKVGVCSDMDEVNSPLLCTTKEFREHFYKHSEMSRKERKERIKKYGHLNTQNLDKDGEHK